MKKATGKLLAIAAILCMSTTARAQFDGGSDYADEWTLDMGEEEDEPKPQHKEYKNTMYLQYSPSVYRIKGVGQPQFHEISVGYAHYFQVLEEKPYFVEIGANMKYSHSDTGKGCDLLSFKIPANVFYKLYLSKTKDIALAPYAGASFRAIAAGKVDGWQACQLGWQAGLRFYMNRFYLGASYGQDFPDETKTPHIHETSVQLGICF